MLSCCVMLSYVDKGLMPPPEVAAFPRVGSNDKSMRVFFTDDGRLQVKCRLLIIFTES